MKEYEMNKPPNLRQEPTCINCVHFQYNTPTQGEYACIKYGVTTHTIYTCDDLHLLINKELKVKSYPIIDTNKYLVK